MGSGKSTIGPALARAIGYDFIDVDRAIERFAGKTVNDIFKEEGEEQFRGYERGLIADLCEKRRLVVALGGGTISDPVNFSAITGAGIVVYLKMTPEQLFARLRSKTNRPMLAGAASEGLNDEALRARLWDLFLRRETFYEKADLMVMAGGREVGPTVDEIVNKLLQHLE